MKYMDSAIQPFTEVQQKMKKGKILVLDITYKAGKMFKDVRETKLCDQRETVGKQLDEVVERMPRSILLSTTINCSKIELDRLAWYFHFGTCQTS